jgi:hypothetical protein
VICAGPLELENVPDPLNGDLMVDPAFYPAAPPGLPGLAVQTRRTGSRRQVRPCRIESHTASAVNQISVPSEPKARRIVEDLWFEANHLGGCLARRALWLGKSG